MHRLSQLRIVAPLCVVALLLSEVAAARDGGGTRDAAVAEAGVRDGGAARDAAAPDAAPADWLAQRSATLTRELTRLRADTAALKALKPTDLQLPEGVAAALDKLDVTDPAAVTRALAQLERQQRILAGQLAESRARAAAVRPALRRALRRFRRATRRRGGRRLPAKVRAAAAAARRRLALLALEEKVLLARGDRLTALSSYLRASQPARVAAAKLRAAAKRKAAAARAKLEQERRKALTDQQEAAAAREKALAAQRAARSEAERLIAGERASLEGVRGNQAKLRQRLTQQKQALRRQRHELERFRGSLAAKADKLAAGWPGTAPRYDKLYDSVVAKLRTLRPLAVADLKAATIEGIEDAPHPGERLSRRVLELAKYYEKRVAALEQLRRELDRKADQLDLELKDLGSERLALLQRETTLLNEHRLKLLRRLTPSKRDNLTGLSRETFRQLTREVTQLGIDGAYWLLTRLRQIDRIPRLIRDVFNVGSVLWNALKIGLLIWLLVFVLRRWNGWLTQAVGQVGRSVTLGRHALLLAKLTDALRNAGPALLVLIVASLIYHLLGGERTASEFRVAYIIFFWVAVYRLQLRLVESGAKYTGMEEALRAAEGEELVEEEEDLEGPPVPRAIRLAQISAQEGLAAQQRVEPASVLLVRSVRAATRYILAVVLVLELTALAVGKGTIYGLTAKFSWWATLPFVLYFLKLWQPHIVRAYQQVAKGARRRQQSALARVVNRAKGRWYGVFVVAVAFAVVLGHRLASFGRRYLTSLDATKKLLAFSFRRRVERHAQQSGRVIAKRQELPDELLAQFPLDPLLPRESPRNTAAMDEIKEVFANWQEDQTDGSVALIGRAGMGRTTTVQLLEQELGVPVRRAEPRTKITRPARMLSWLADAFGFGEQPSSERDLVRMIREDRQPVMAIDNCHDLFLRRVGGFEGWHAFIRVVNETCDNVFWVLTFNQAAWDYLHNVSGRVHYFRRAIVMPAWSEREIRRLIMGRLRRARYKASFSDLVVAEVAGVHASAQLGRTSQGYFRLLWDFTGGNPRLANHFWLDSLLPDETARTVRVHLFATPPLHKLERLPDDIVFVITAIAEHENLTPDETSRVTNLAPDFCAFACRLCLEEGFLWRDKSSGRLRLSLGWQRSIMRFLRRRHLLRD